MVPVLLVDKKDFRKSMVIDSFMATISIATMPQIPMQLSISIEPLPGPTILEFCFTGRQTRSGKLIYREE